MIKVMKTGNTAYKAAIRLAIATGIILLLPFIAMQFTDEVVWDLADFVAAGVLLFGTGLAYELMARKGGTVAYRAAAGVALATVFLLVWVNGAVGIIGSENNDANLMYFGVLAVGIIGAIIAAVTAAWNGARVVCDSVSSGVGSRDRTYHLAAHVLGRSGCVRCVRSERVLCRAISRICLAVSEKCA